MIWATQVLESLVKIGIPTRAEISDAAMSARAECVMLNKGPYIVQAVSTLARILEKMQRHQSKKKALLHTLNFGNLPVTYSQNRNQTKNQADLNESHQPLCRAPQETKN